MIERSHIVRHASVQTLKPSTAQTGPEPDPHRDAAFIVRVRDCRIRTLGDRGLLGSLQVTEANPSATEVKANLSSRPSHVFSLLHCWRCCHRSQPGALAIRPSTISNGLCDPSLVKLERGELRPTTR
jgi:hypothetical protein